MLLFINKREGGHYIDAAIAKTSVTLPTKSSAHNLEFLFFLHCSLKENPQTPLTNR